MLVGRSTGDGPHAAHVARERAAERTPEEARLAGRGEETTAPVEEAVPEDGAGGASLRIEATHDDSGERLAGMRIAVVDAAGRRHEGITGESGEVQLSGLAPGDARVEGAQAGWVGYGEEIELFADDTHAAFLSFLRAVPVKGRVLSEAHGTPVAGALVIAADEMTLGQETSTATGDVWGVARTDAEGWFALPAVPRGEILTFTVLAPGCARLLRTMTFHEASTAEDVVLRLHPGGSVKGVVVDRRGQGVSPALVYVYPDGDEILADDPSVVWSDGERVGGALETWTGADGGFRIDGLTLGARYAVTAFGGIELRAKDVRGAVATAEAPELEVRLVIPDPGAVEVWVRDEDGNGLAAGRARFGRHTFRWPRGKAEWKANPSGRILRSDLPAGAMEVRAEADGFLPRTVKTVVAEGETTSLEVRLQRGVAIAGVVVDEEGNPLADIQVRIKPADGDTQHHERTDAQGRFQVGGLERERYRVDAGGRGYLTPKVRRVDAPATDLRLVCRRMGRVRGRLLLPPGSPIPTNFQIGFYDSAVGGWATHEAWNGGRFEKVVGPDKSVLRIQGDGFAPFVREVHADLGEIVDLGDLSLSAGVSCRGVVVDADGDPVAHAAVEALEHEWRLTQTDAAGRFRLEHLAPEDLCLAVEADGFLERTIWPDGADLAGEMRVVLARGALLRILLLDAEGLPVVDGELEVGSTDVTYAGHEDDHFTSTAWETTDESGRAAVRLSPGAYRIEASKGEEILARGTVTLREGETADVMLRP